MAEDDSDRFRIRPGRQRSRGAPVHLRALPFLQQVVITVRKQGGNLNRIGGRSGAGKGSGRFNVRGRGAKLAASFPTDGVGWRRDGSGIRYRSRRVVVVARVVKLTSRTKAGARARKFVTTSKAVNAHLRYLERDGVTTDGEKGKVYSAVEDEADGKAFIKRERGDRHQFRFIVAPEDAAQMENLRSFTRGLMRQMEQDLGTGLDWIAIDHHNTGHPHTHILVRGATDDGKILYIAGDYIAHGIRHRASEMVTRELGPQTELDVARKLRQEVDAERLTRLDRILIAEQQERGIVDLRPNADNASRSNRYLQIDRAKKLERFGLASEVDPGRWMISDRAEGTLRALGERNDVIKIMYRALEDHGIADERAPYQYVTHGKTITEPIAGRVLGKGLAGNEMTDRLYVVIDGVDGHTHYIETADASKLDEIKRGHIVALDPVLPNTEPKPSDLNIRDIAGGSGIYRPSEHLKAARAKIEHAGGDPEAFTRSHVRRLEALRRAGVVERIDDDHWKVPNDVAERGMAYDARNRGRDFCVRVLSILDLEAQIGSDGATWLDRELASPNRTPLAEAGFGREVSMAMDRRRQSLVEMGHAIRLPDGTVRAPKDILRRLEQAEIARIGRGMAAERGLAFRPSNPGEYVSGELVGMASLASGRFAMIDDGLGFQLVPWQPFLAERIGQYITGIARDGGGIEWSFGKMRGLEIGM
jgi:type IV secretory pathway VirD2 relaxase